jgi:hypothetical protein
MRLEVSILEYVLASTQNACLDFRFDYSIIFHSKICLKLFHKSAKVKENEIRLILYSCVLLFLSPGSSSDLSGVGEN